MIVYHFLHTSVHQITSKYISYYKVIYKNILDPYDTFHWDSMHDRPKYFHAGILSKTYFYNVESAYLICVRYKGPCGDVDVVSHPVERHRTA